jgi:hypothetical protein
MVDMGDGDFRRLLAGKLDEGSVEPGAKDLVVYYRRETIVYSALTDMLRSRL